MAQPSDAIAEYIAIFCEETNSVVCMEESFRLNVCNLIARSLGIESIELVAEQDLEKALEACDSILQAANSLERRRKDVTYRA